MIKNKFYEAPETELILVGFEGNFCTTGYQPAPGAAGADEEYNDLGDF